MQGRQRQEPSGHLPGHLPGRQERPELLERFPEPLERFPEPLERLPEPLERQARRQLSRGLQVSRVGARYFPAAA